MDRAIFLWINHGWSSPLLDPFFLWVSQTWTFSYPLLLIFLALWWRQYGRAGLYLWLVVIVTIGLGDAFGNQLKHHFDQFRPCFDMVGTAHYVGHAAGSTCTDSSSGLPSNHALNFFAAAAVITLVLRRWRWGIGLFGLAVLVAISRVYLAKHYPSQVFVGGVLGIGWGLLWGYLALRFLPPVRRVCPALNPTPESNTATES